MADANSVYQLVTKLCEVQLSAQQKQVTSGAVKKLRSKAFDLLLFKRKRIYDPFWLENCNDYHCQFLAWQFVLRSTYKQEKMAATLDSCVQAVMASNYDPHTIDSILHVLLKLKRPPKTLAPIEFNTKTMTKIYRKFLQSDFHLQQPATSLDVQLSAKSFNMKCSHSIFFSPDVDGDSEFAFQSARSSISHSKSKSASSPSSPSTCGCTDFNELENSTHKEMSVWEMVSNIKFNKKRTWEAIGNSTPAKEKVFLSEAADNIYGAIEKMRHMKTFDYQPLPVLVLKRQEYMKDLKSLVVGIQSNTFVESDSIFVLNANILFEGISWDVFKQYAMLMINVGVCYKALEAMVADVLGKTDEEHGCVYMEFHRAVDRYLIFYRAASVNVDVNKGIIQYHAHVRRLSTHLFAVAAICKTGTFTVVNNELKVVDLLNVLYRKVFTQLDQQVLLVLHALLFPCLQIYFLKYLNPWLLEGTLNDPFEEFFIRESKKYLVSRGRTYWTRSFSTCEEAIPAFCADFAMKIFECGKITNLLKLCAPKASIFECHNAMSRTQKERFMQCCVTEDQLRRMKMGVEEYELEVIAKIGATAFSLKRMFEYKRDEGLVFNKFLALRKASSIKKIQMNKIEKLSHDIKSIQSSDECIESKKKQIEIIKTEAENIIAFYDNLAETAHKFDKQITMLNETMKNLNLDASPQRVVKSPRKSSKLPRRIIKKIEMRCEDKQKLSPRSNARRNKLEVTATEFESSLQPLWPQSSSSCDKQAPQELGAEAGNQMNINDVQLPQFDTYISAPKFELTRLDSENKLLTPPIAPVSATKIEQYYQSFRCFGKSTLEEDTTATPMRVSLHEISHIRFPYLNTVIARSIQLPLQVQLSLVKSELLKHFVLEREYLTHMENLRSFYFLLDGGFARVLINWLCEQVNNTSDDLELEEAFDHDLFTEVLRYAREACYTRVACKQRLSLHYIHMPRIAMLGDVFVLDCVSMVYETKWPLNVLLPTKTIAKYDELFKFMLKIHRVLWVLKRIFTDFKLLRKQYGREGALLMTSNHYQKINLWRHIMMHFVQNFYSYIVGEVFQSSWSVFHNALVDIDDFDELYKAQGIYMRQIHFLCFQHQKTSPVRDIVMNVFGIVLKFYEYLRTREWKLYTREFVHPNFLKMECIFHNFLSLAKYFLKICRKLARAAYQPQFNQLIDLLDINRFYSTFSNAL